MSNSQSAHHTDYHLAPDGGGHLTDAKYLQFLSNHSEDIGKKPKAERGLSKADAQAINKEYGVVLAVDSGAWSLLKSYFTYIFIYLNLIDCNNNNTSRHYFVLRL